MTNIKTPSDLVNRLRETASKGVSVWGDLQMEAAREIEILTAEREAYVSAMDRLQSALPAQEPVKFLANRTRFKLSFDTRGRVSSLWNFMDELDGRWVALVAAENDCHLQSAQPVAQPLTLEQLLDIVKKLGEPT